MVVCCLSAREKRHKHSSVDRVHIQTNVRKSCSEEDNTVDSHLG